MAFLKIHGLTFEIAGRILIKNADLAFAAGDRIALVGKNGSGKTTFLKILASLAGEYEGKIDGLRRLRIGYLPQEPPEFAGNKSVFDTAHGYLERAAPVYDLYEKDLKKNLSMLGFDTDDHWRMLSEFSAGFKMKAALAGIMTSEPDLLLLDEPENHLDESSIRSLASALNDFKGILIFVSHDPSFVNDCANAVLELHDAVMHLYPGDYGKYSALSAEYAALLEKENREKIERIRKLRNFIQKNIADKSTAGAAHAREKELKKIIVPEMKKEGRNIVFEFPPSQPEPAMHVKLSGLKLYYGNMNVIKDGDICVERGDRIAFYSPNGSGKTTVLDFIGGTGSALCETLVRKISEKTVMTSFSACDDISSMSDLSLEDYVRRVFSADYREVLGKFLFTEDLHRKIEVLSGGEKARLILINLISRSANLILLDEPTSNLDKQTRDVFRDVLKRFPGAVILASHDEALFDGLTNKVWTVKNKVLKEYYGEFSYIKTKFLDGQKEAAAYVFKSDNNPKTIRKKRQLYREELEKVMSDIERAEEEIFGQEILLVEERNPESAERIRNRIIKAKKKLQGRMELKNALFNKLNLFDDS